MEPIKFSDSFLEFLKKKRYESRIAETLYYEIHDSEVNYTTTENINYITFRTDGTISFLPSDKEHKTNDNGDWARDGRQNGKPAKVIRKLFTKEGLELFKDSDFEYFANSYKANYSNEGFVFTLLPAKDIPKVYEMERENSGTLGDSCMNDDAEYFDIYTACKSLQILTLQKDGKLHGRALIWQIGDITLMDRMYVSKDFLYENFLEYAKANQYLRKANYKSYSDKTTFVKPDGTEINQKFTINTPTDFDQYPYIDTFSYGDDGTLNNFGGQYAYCDTGGNREGGEDDHDGQVYDDINGEYIDEEDSVCINSGDRRYRNMITHRDNVVYIESEGEYYHEDDSHIVDVDGDWYLKTDDEICQLTNGDWVKSDDCVETNDGWQLLDDCVYCDRDSCYYLNNDCVETNKGEYILEEEAVKNGAGDWIHTDDLEDDTTGEVDEYIENPNQLKLFTDDDIESKEAA